MELWLCFSMSPSHHFSLFSFFFGLVALPEAGCLSSPGSAQAWLQGSTRKNLPPFLHPPSPFLPFSVNTIPIGHWLSPQPLIWGSMSQPGSGGCAPPPTTPWPCGCLCSPFPCHGHPALLSTFHTDLTVPALLLFSQADKPCPALAYHTGQGEQGRCGGDAPVPVPSRRCPCGRLARRAAPLHRARLLGHHGAGWLFCSCQNNGNNTNKPPSR